MDGYPNVCGGDFWQQTETRNNKRMLHKQVTQEKGSLTRCGKMCEKVEQAQLARIQEGWEIDLAMPLRDHNAFARRNHRPAFGPHGGSTGQGRDRTADTWIFRRPGPDS